MTQAPLDVLYKDVPVIKYSYLLPVLTAHSMYNYSSELFSANIQACRSSLNLNYLFVLINRGISIVTSYVFQPEIVVLRIKTLTKMFVADAAV